MERVRFRRPVRPGCEWLLEATISQSSEDGYSLLSSEDAGDLSINGHRRLAMILLKRIVRHASTDHDPILLHRTTEHLLRATEAQPSDALLHRSLGTAFLLAGEVDAGVAALETSISLRPTQRADIEADLMRMCLENGKAASIAARYDILLQRKPETPLQASCLAAYYRSHGALEDARIQLLEARQRWPSSLSLYADLAITLWDAEDPTSALYHFSVMRDENPGRPWIEWNFIAALAATGNQAAAEREYRNCSPSVATDHELRALMQRCRPDMKASSLLSGDLSTVSLADILNLLWHCQSIGTLSVDSTAGRGGLHFWKGRLVGAVSPRLSLDPDAGHGGSISWLSPEAVIERPAGQQNPADRRSAVYQQVRSALEEMLGWTSGRFVFQSLGDASFPEAANEIALDTPVVLLEACADLDSKNR